MQISGEELRDLVRLLARLYRDPETRVLLDPDDYPALRQFLARIKLDQ